MPVKTSPPVTALTMTSPSPLKKNKTNRTFRFLSGIAERAFKEKFESMMEKFLTRSSSIS